MRDYWKSTGKCQVLSPDYRAHPQAKILHRDAYAQQVIKKVNRIGLREKQRREFYFLNRSKEPYEWTNMVPKDDPEFQGLLEEELLFPEMSAKLPGVPLRKMGHGQGG
jgi:hypothetical protein